MLLDKEGTWADSTLRVLNAQRQAMSLRASLSIVQERAALPRIIETHTGIVFPLPATSRLVFLSTSQGLVFLHHHPTWSLSMGFFGFFLSYLLTEFSKK